jgi:hypothetical protein
VAVEELLGVVGHQPRLAFAVADLLAPIGFDRCPVMMPDQRGRGEADLPTACLQPPAHVHIVAGTEVDRVEAADREQRVALERHVAAGHVLGDPIVQQHVSGTAGGAGDALRDRGIVAGHDVRSARPDHVGDEKRLDQEGQPVRIDARVGIGVGDDLPGRFRQPDIARRTQPLIRRVDHPHPRMPPGDFAGAIFRSIVDQDDLVVGIREPLERPQVVLERIFGVIRADDHRNARPGQALFWREWCVRKRLGNRHRGELRTAVGVDQTELPVVHPIPAAPPFVGPRKRKHAAEPLFERGADVHRRDIGLPLFAFADAVGAGFRQQQRLVAGDMLQPREVGAQLRLAMQVDVERTDIEERKVEEFGGREVHVGEQRLRHRRLRVFVELVEKPFDSDPSVPAHDARRNLVAERDRQQRRMAPQLADAADELAADLALERAIVEKRHVLRPGDADHHAQPPPRRFVEEIKTRRRVRSHRVQAELGHQPEILGDTRELGELIPVGVGCERPVGDALDEEALVADTKELPVRCDVRGYQRTGFVPSRRSGLDGCSGQTLIVSVR